MAKPDRDLVERVLATFANAEDVDYFFDQLTSPNWIEPLAAVGLFSSPPEPKPVDGGVQFPPWSASRYLARMANKDPEVVRRVLLGIPETENVRVLHDISDAVLALPPTMAVEFVPRLVGWLDSPYQLLLPTKLAALLRRLALAGLTESAINLAAALFRIHAGEVLSVNADATTFDFPTEAIPVIDSYEYEQLIEESRQDLISGTGLSGLIFLSDLLATAMKLEARDPDGEKRDYSLIWRPAIEPHAQNSVPSVRNSIVSTVRDAAGQIVSSDRSLLAEVVNLLEARGWSVLRRIALDVLRTAASKRSAQVSERLLSAKWMFDNDVHHEYWMLLRTHFSHLTPRQRNKLLEAIRRGPESYRDPEGPFADNSELALECWQVRLLAAIADDLSGEVRAWFDELRAKGRLGENPEFLSFSSGGWVGPTSPIGDVEFAAMSDDQLIDYLRTWEPEPEELGLDRPSPEGLGRALAEAARADPARFAEYADKFRALDPTYVNAILSAFRESATTGMSFSWAPILQLTEWVVQQGSETPARRVSRYGDRDHGWLSTRSTIAHLLDVGFNEGGAEIPFEFRPLVWSILEPLTNDPNPTIEDEAKYGGSNMDPTTLAINTVRGQALSAAVKYALWTRRHLEETDKHEGLSRMPEVQVVLDAHLSLSREPSYAVHSIYGQWLPWLELLDREWTKTNLSGILPSQEDEFLYWEAAWDAYISYCAPYDDVFDLLREEYLRAVTRVGSASTDRKHPMLGPTHLGEHLMVFYLRRILNLDSPLLQEFFSTVAPPLRSSSLRFVGRSLYVIVDNSVQPLPSAPSTEVIDRARVLWESRLELAEAESVAEGLSLELAEFGWWFISPAFDDIWALDKLTAALRVAGHIEAGHLVIRKMAELVASHPMPVLDALQLMLRGTHDRWLLLSRQDALRHLLRSALQNPDASVRQRAEEMTHELGARGYREFRDLLN